MLATTRVLEVRGVRYRHRERATHREYVVIGAPEWVNVVALTPDRKLVLVKQFRFGIDDFSLEIPGGMVEPGEDPVDAAVRELKEETGYVGRRAKLMGAVHPNPAIQSNRCHLVLVEDARLAGATAWDPDEEIEVSTEPVDKVLRWARSGRISHALVLCGLFLFEKRWRERVGRGV